MPVREKLGELGGKVGIGDGRMGGKEGGWKLEKKGLIAICSCD